jgi:hypothetical protein
VLGVTGVDPGTDGYGTHVCVLDDSYGVDNDSLPQGTGVVVEVLNCHGAETFPCPRTLDHTGAYYYTDGTGGGHLCVMIDGVPRCG